DSRRPADLERWPCIKKMQGLASSRQHFLHAPFLLTGHTLVVSLAPQPLDDRRDVPRVWANKAYVNIAPAGTARQMPLLGFFRRADAILIDDVHPAEVSNLVIDDEQLAMVSLIQNMQGFKPSVEHRTQVVEHVHIDTGVAHPFDRTVG